MISLKKKMGNTKPEVAEAYYPSVSLDANQVKDLKGFDIVDNVTLTFKAKVKSINAYGDGDRSVGLDLLECEVGSKKDKE